ncbi:hypothetical protein [Streptomyces sp. NPDC048603]|uniref:hypothetical protein n=1 Tax=Streptomyces sp. NPDC048603 TaxID=3365577 RepID=UPI003720FF4E
MPETSPVLLAEGARVRRVADHSRMGTVDDVDSGDPVMPYHVKWDDDEYGVWVYAEDIEAVPAPSTADRESLVTRAKELLAGTAHTGADVVAMAAFLAGER